MFFYRRPGWGIGFRILMVFLLIAGGIALTRSAFQVGFMQGAAMEGGEFTAPTFYPHARGFAPLPFAMGGSFLMVLAVFFGGLLLIKLITSIIGLVMFKRWKAEGGPDRKDWSPYYKFGHHPAYCGPHQMGYWGPHPLHMGPWDRYPEHDPEGRAGKPADTDESAEDQS